MAEEQRCQEGHRLCTNNCGFFGSPATLNLCSKCYRDYRLKEDQASSVKIAVEKSLLPSSSSATVVVDAAPLSISAIAPETETSAAGHADPLSISEAAPPPPDQLPANRCAACRKKAGLMGFRCRCGDTYCGAHLYPERHRCVFDFKAAGKESIARANPVVKAAKLEKI